MKCADCDIELDVNNSYINKNKCKKCYNNSRKMCKSYTTKYKRTSIKLLDEDKKIEIQNKLNAGISYWALSKEYGVSHVTLMKYFRRN